MIRSLKYLFFCSWVTCWAYNKVWPIDSAGKHELELQLDAYYSALDYVVSLTDEAVPKLDAKEQKGYLSYLFRHFFRPRFALVEASINPLPISGVAIKNYYREFYEKAQWNEGLNLVKVVTVGLPEPGAVSLFFGNVVNLVDQKETVGRGYSGFLVSYGNYHIVDNSMYRDDWLEMEMKIKGAALGEWTKSAWSFRIGTKQHFNTLIHDVLYLALKWERENRKKSAWSLLENTTYEYRVDVDQSLVLDIAKHLDKTAVRYIAILGKKFPFQDGKWALSIDLGVIRQVGSGYSGKLKDAVTPEWIAVLRPNISF